MNSSLRNTNRQDTHEIILSHQENINPNYSGIPSHHSQNECHQVKREQRNNKARKKQILRALGVWKQFTVLVGM